jgi:hypothetical protein
LVVVDRGNQVCLGSNHFVSIKYIRKYSTESRKLYKI